MTEKDLFEKLQLIQEAYNKGLVTGAEEERLAREAEQKVDSRKDGGRAQECTSSYHLS